MKTYCSDLALYGKLYRRDYFLYLGVIATAYLALFNPAVYELVNVHRTVHWVVPLDSMASLTLIMKRRMVLQVTQ